MTLKDKTLALVALAPSSREQANREPDDVEIWGTHGTWNFLKRCDRLFQIHSAEILLGNTSAIQELAVLRMMQTPIYVTDDLLIEQLPSALLYPFGEIEFDYLTSTVAYMLALAIAEGFKEIHLHGIDMRGSSQYADQRPCCEFWLGIAKEKGIKVVIPDSSALLKPEGGTYGLYPSRSITKERLLDILGKMTKQGNEATDPQEKMFVWGAYNLTKDLLLEVAPELEGTELQYK